MADRNVGMEDRLSESELLKLDGGKEVIKILDVMTSNQINRILVLNILFAVITFGHVIILASCCATVLHGEKE